MKGAGDIEGRVAIVVRARAFLAMGMLAIDAGYRASIDGESHMGGKCIALEGVGIEAV